MPELYAGLQRTVMNFPVQYRGANVPQAWAAASTFMFLQTMLGLVADEPRSRLYVDPFLPDWLRDVTLRDLRLGPHKLDIRFWRAGAETCSQVLSGEPLSSRGGALRPDRHCLRGART